MAFPVNVRDLMKAGAALADERDKPLSIAVAVELDAPDALLAAMEDALKPRTARVDVAVGVVGESAPPVTTSTDAVVALLGSGGADMAAFLAAAHAKGLAAVTLLVGGAGGASAAALGQPLDDFLVGDDPRTLVRADLARWLADHAAGKRLAIASAFDFMRPAVANEFVKATAWQNALIGGVVIIPGADMPLMTGNQAKMVLQIAAAYGQKLDTDRAKELLAVVGGGFAFRAVARELLDFVPGFGWALKAGIAYAGTQAMGKAAIAYFEQGADLGGVVRKLEEGAADVAQRVLPKKDDNGRGAASRADGHRPVQGGGRGWRRRRQLTSSAASSRCWRGSSVRRATSTASGPRVTCPTPPTGPRCRTPTRTSSAWRTRPSASSTSA